MSKKETTRNTTKVIYVKNEKIDEDRTHKNGNETNDQNIVYEVAKPQKEQKINTHTQTHKQLKATEANQSEAKESKAK